MYNFQTLLCFYENRLDANARFTFSDNFSFLSVFLLHEVCVCRKTRVHMQFVIVWGFRVGQIYD